MNISSKSEHDNSFFLTDKLKTRLSRGLWFPNGRDTMVKLFFDETVAERFNVQFLQTFDTEKGPGVVIGCDDYSLWFWVGEYGLCSWFDVKGNIEKYPQFKANPSLPLPHALVQYVEKQIKEVSNYDSVAKELFIHLNVDILEDSNLPIALRSIFVTKPWEFYQSLSVMLSDLDEIVAFDKKKVDSKLQVIPMLDEKYERIEKILNYTINTVLEFEIDYSLFDISIINGDYFLYRDMICKKLGEFIFLNADSSNGKQVIAQTALLYFLLVRTTDQTIEVLKKSCYLQLLGEKMRPAEYDHATYCEQKPEQFIELAERVLDLLSERLSLAQYHRTISFEIVQLLYFASQAYAKTHQTEKANNYKVDAKVRLEQLLKGRPNQEVLLFARQYFGTDPHVCIWLATCYFRLKDFILSDKYLDEVRLHIKSSPHFDPSDSFIDYVYLLAKGRVNYQVIAKNIVKKCMLDANSPVVKFFRERADDTQLRVLLRDAYLELAQEKGEKKYYELAYKMIALSFAKNMQDSDDHYYLYICNMILYGKADPMRLNAAAEMGNQKAIDLMESLEDPFIRCLVAQLYRKGKGVAKNCYLAARYLRMAGNDEAKLQLADMVFTKEIDSDKGEMNPVDLLNAIIISPTSTDERKKKAISLLTENFQQEQGKYYPQLVLVMARIEHQGLYKQQVDYQQAAEYYERYVLVNPDDYEAVIPAIRSKNVAFFLKSKTICAVILKVYENNKALINDEDLKLLASLIDSRQDDNIHELALSYPKVLLYLDGKLITILDYLITAFKPDELQNIVAEKIASGGQRNALLKWLQNQIDVLRCMLSDISSLVKLQDITEWQSFMAQANVQKIIRSLGFMQENNGSNSIVKSIASTFFGKKIETDGFITKMQSSYIEKKTEVWHYVTRRKKEFLSTPQSNEFKFYAELIDALNETKNFHQLDKLLERLEAHDKTFSLKLSETSLVNKR